MNTLTSNTLTSSEGPVAPQMDAVVMEAGGPPAQSLAHRSVSVPEPGLGEVLVEVHAAAVNPLDIANAAGLLGSPLPMIPGGDFAGVVVSDGAHQGEEVWGSGPALGMAVGEKRPGTHARFVVLPETWLSRKPECLTMTEAAAVGRSHFTAWQALINSLELQPGETVLITGGSGLVGQAATAIARWRGAEPIVVGRRRPAGVEHFIDISSTGAGSTDLNPTDINPTDIREAVLDLTDGRGADTALDTVGGALSEPAIRSLRSGGRMAMIAAGAPDRQASVPVSEIISRQLHLTGLATVFLDGADVAHIFDQLRPLFERGFLVPPAAKTWPLDDAVQAYQAVLDGSAGIKQVLLPAVG
ncbi:zinc-binding alcohol dehydrogenase family protein [Catenulispora sp. NL8]|uniref:Zinc-binding alcohol dehydrogenase family protein n=1 Tax=Catenulispora pinistramenti TaxID=2705254 RepID=A0ABS5L015_9ACTN|nr:zinc-binding alcohol dehydrogenase family protein [Catenulispora pinistramenti]MBS2551677.1 zinc-binding alcohol dehydrogenase family protein [Catenulispora pinistramenti]